eukprot:CAMPEP_0178924660 /NCGR_PEP_ID=MMETSP0786-20121207/17452_1 /TAXON_ID=186022 /ORGANISM="Thalassionema frauenfeldii, Strain CCMP 1798" /LENGTH=414 /DNA_ID=CAMNT_0020599399 /DNA_START=111 /DNA_END=1352 /DNA_ORIENTATION=+
MGTNSKETCEESRNGGVDDVNHFNVPITEIVQPQQAPDFGIDDNSSGRDYTGVFEGPEKTLEVCFRRIGGGNHNDEKNKNQVGLRKLKREHLDQLCARARCTILSRVSNEHLDAYVLSESSLFVYPYMLVLKTCGTTTLLRVISFLIDLAKTYCQLEIMWLGYSRKNFSFPGDQEFPHQSFHQELEYLDSHHILSERLNGNGYTLGPVNSDHWFVFVADHTVRVNPDTDTDRVLNIMMFEIDPEVSKLFFYEEYGEKNIENEECNNMEYQHTKKLDRHKMISSEMTVKSGIEALCPDALLDAQAFEPCGYSMNAIAGASYTTIHITPESGSSYASFETNRKLGAAKLIPQVLKTFRPKRFVMTLMADELGLMDYENPLKMSTINVDAKNKMIFKRNSLASIQVEDDCCCMMGNW